jgi:hypothetical protein
LAWLTVGMSVVLGGRVGFASSSRQVPDLCPGKIISQEWRLCHPKDASAASALDGDLCSGDRIARREEDGPAALAGAVTGVRDGGIRLAAGVGERRCGGGPRRASPTLSLDPPRNCGSGGACRRGRCPLSWDDGSC